MTEDRIDIINDKLTDCDAGGLEELSDLIPQIDRAVEVLRDEGYDLNEDEIESTVENLDAPAFEDEGERILLPVYKDGAVSEYNLAITYFRDGAYDIAFELQYSWEDELEDDEDFLFGVELDDYDEL